MKMKIILASVIIMIVYLVLFILQHSIFSKLQGKKDVITSEKQILQSFSKNNSEISVLYCIALGSMDRLDVLETLLDNVLDWCEAGYNTHVIIDTFDSSVLQSEISNILQRQLSTCSRDDSFATVEIIHHENNPRVILVSQHRKHFSRLLNKFSLFIFTEDDISIRLSTLRRWISATNNLKHLSLNYFVGMIRYENARVMNRDKHVRKRISQLRPNFNLTTSDGTVLNRLTWELSPSDLVLLNHSNAPDLTAIGLHDNSYFTISPDITPFSAAGIFYRNQLVELEVQCNYLSTQNAELLLNITNNSFHPFQAFYSSSQPFACGDFESQYGSGIFDLHSPEFFCCKTWIFPTDKIETLFIHHIGTPGSKGDNKWVNRHRINNATFLHDWYLILKQTKNEAMHKSRIN